MVAAPPVLGPPRPRLEAALARAGGLLGGSEATRLLTRDSATSFGVRGVGLGLALLSGIVLARLAGADGYGGYVLALNWMAFAAIPATLGLDYVVVRYAASYATAGDWAGLRGLLRYSHRLGLVAGIAAGVLGYAALRLLLPDPGLAAAIAVSMAAVPLSVGLLLRLAALRGLQRPFLAQAPESLLVPLALLAIAGALAATLGAPPTAAHLMAANAGALLLGLLAAAALLHRAVPREARAAAPREDRGAWMAMVPPLVAIAGLQFLLNRAGILLMGALAAPRDAGIFAVAARGGEMAIFVMDATMFAGAPLIAALHARGDRAELQRVVTHLSRLNLWLTLPIAAGLVLAAPWFLGLFGPEFVAGTDAMRVLVAAQYLGAVAGAVGVMLYMTGHQRDVLVVMAATGSLNVLLGLALIPAHGALGAALAAAASLLAFKAALVAVIHRRLGVLSLPFAPRTPPEMTP